MADGSQGMFHLPMLKATSRLRDGEIVVDLFAGGGGASTALEQALGRPVDIAINHNPWAVSMHAANHPYTRHLCEDVWKADPVREVAGRAVGWLHASPDCTHFSQAKGGQPRSGKVRALSWCVLRWAGKTRPRIISLENVHQILKWGPLVAKRCKATGRVLKLDGSVAARGERVPLDQQFLIPDKRQQGRTWRQFVAALRGLGYAVEWKRLKACDYGAGTSRERLFLVARCDGKPIAWPEPTHGPGRAQPYVTAADCIDWSIACPSIFTRAKPLADATLRRIARGIRRYVLDADVPFIVEPGEVGMSKGDAEHLHSISEGRRSTRPRQGSEGHVVPARATLGTRDAGRDNSGHSQRSPTHVTRLHRRGRPGVPHHENLIAGTLVQTGYGERVGQEPRVPGLDKPIGTLVDGQKHAAVTAALVKFRGDSDGANIQEPTPTITSGSGAARPAGAPHALGVMTAFLEQAAGGPNSNTSRPRAASEPVSTISTKGSQQRLVAANMVTLRGDNVGAATDQPVRTLSAGGEHHAVVECTLSPEHEAGALQVAAFLLRYYGTGGQWGEITEPAHAITTKDRLALVTVTVRGTPYVIVDIGLRMLQRHELFRAQGFPADYIIDRTADGRTLSVSRSVGMCGNSVSPPPHCAVVNANADPIDVPASLAA